MQDGFGLQLLGAGLGLLNLLNLSKRDVQVFFVTDCCLNLHKTALEILNNYWFLNFDFRVLNICIFQSEMMPSILVMADL